MIALLTQRYGGTTTSQLDRPVFIGFWQDHNGNVVVDDIAVVIVDIRDRSVDDATSRAELEDVREFVFESYQAIGSPQAEVWLVASAVRLFVT